MKWAFTTAEWQVTQRIMSYYQSLLPREQRLVLFAAVILPVLLFIFGLALPLMDARDMKHASLLALQTQALEAESLARQLSRHGQHKTNDNTMAVVDQQARRTGVRSFIVRMRPQPAKDHKQRLLIHMRDVPYIKTVRFLHALSKQGLNLLQVKLQQAKKPAYIHVQVTVE